MQTFHTKSGRLTPYALACGYIEKKEIGGVAVTLWREHSVYHVRAHNHENGMRLYWDSFSRLGEARARFDKGLTKRA